MATINGVETNESFLEGTEQNDSIFGGMGDETVDGKGGSDLMDASGGKNILTGGTGADLHTTAEKQATIPSPIMQRRIRYSRRKEEAVRPGISTGLRFPGMTSLSRSKILGLTGPAITE